MPLSHRMGPILKRSARASDLQREDQLVDDVDHAAGVDEPYGDLGDIRRQMSEPGLAADNGEGLAIDGVGVAEVLKRALGRFHPSRFRRFGSTACVLRQAQDEVVCFRHEESLSS